MLFTLKNNNGKYECTKILSGGTDITAQYKNIVGGVKNDTLFKFHYQTMTLTVDTVAKTYVFDDNNGGQNGYSVSSLKVNNKDYLADLTKHDQLENPDKNGLNAIFASKPEVIFEFTYDGKQYRCTSVYKSDWKTYICTKVEVDSEDKTEELADNKSRTFVQDGYLNCSYTIDDTFSATVAVLPSVNGYIFIGEGGVTFDDIWVNGIACKALLEEY